MSWIWKMSFPWTITDSCRKISDRAGKSLLLVGSWRSTDTGTTGTAVVMHGAWCLVTSVTLALFLWTSKLCPFAIESNVPRRPFHLLLRWLPSGNRWQSLPEQVKAHVEQIRTNRTASQINPIQIQKAGCACHFLLGDIRPFSFTEMLSYNNVINCHHLPAPYFRTSQHEKKAATSCSQLFYRRNTERKSKAKKFNHYKI